MDLNLIIDLERGPRAYLIRWLQMRHLLANPLSCARCNCAMEMKERNDDHIDGRCSGCKKRRSLRANSFFGEFPKVSLGAILRVIFSFTQDDSQRRMAENVNLNRNLVSHICRTLQDFCSMDLQYRPVIPFGGAGAVVKCDESKFNHKAKYNRGRRPARDTWVFGIITAEYSPARGYFTVVDRRDADTLWPIIDQCILPGSEVQTDDWGAYRGLTRLANVQRHRVVVHARNFVDPRTGVHTQEVESCWSQLKLGLKRRKGIRRKDLQSYLDEMMWRQWR
ncbi:hypothetical protein P5673_020277, partial [Acropora cervicornis]